MGYRILADENIGQATVTYLRECGHDVEWIGDVPELGLGASDGAIATYARETNRLILTQDDDFFIELEHGAGVLFQTDQTLSASEVGEAIQEMLEEDAGDE